MLPKKRYRAGQAGTLDDRKVVLVVEDKAVAMRTIEQMLTFAGYTVLEASSSREALALCQQYPGPIHVALIDVSVDNMSDIATGKRLLELRTGLKILIMTGFFGPGLVENDLLTISSHFLQKPISLSELYTKIEKVLSSNAADRDSTPD